MFKWWSPYGEWWRMSDECCSNGGVCMVKAVLMVESMVNVGLCMVMVEYVW